MSAPPDRQLPPTIDPAAARWHAAAPAASPWLHEEVARRMEDRLQWIRQAPAAWADWDPVRGGLQGHGLVARRYPGAVAWIAETAPEHLPAAREALVRPWWSPGRWASGAPRFGLPPDGGVQMLWANMALHLAADPQALIARWHRALAVDGYLMFSCLGPDTVRELHALHAALGWPPAGHAMTDMHDWGDMLVQQGFAEPVMDMERITLTFATPARLLQELRELGRNFHPARFPALRGSRAWRDRLEQALAERLASPEHGGQLALTFEIIYGHAFKPAPRLKGERKQRGLAAGHACHAAPGAHARALKAGAAPRGGFSRADTARDPNPPQATICGLWDWPARAQHARATHPAPRTCPSAWRLRAPSPGRSVARPPPSLLMVCTGPGRGWRPRYCNRATGTACCAMHGWPPRGAAGWCRQGQERDTRAALPAPRVRSRRVRAEPGAPWPGGRCAPAVGIRMPPGAARPTRARPGERVN